ncbi:MAG: carboxypeptidase-like regulatory domain-containing protein, partial [Acidobacteria bacterium]|nr:carboxypeptidase-like regulatory domain-containing protein [Acidobacteriota bacterium]
MVRQLCRLFSVFVVILFWSGDVELAQSQARLTGIVTDSSGAVVVGAKVMARNVATGLAYSGSTSDSGTYVLPLLPPGEYELNCELVGFKRFAQSGVVLETGFARALDIRLEVGEVTETVNVEAATPLLESETSSVGQLIERAQVANMPVESRRAASLIRLMGAVVYREELQGSGEAIPAFSMAGGRSVNQMWLLDGAVVQNMALGAPLL